MEELIPLFKTLDERIAAETKAYKQQVSALKLKYEQDSIAIQDQHDWRVADIQQVGAGIDARLHKWYAETTFETFFDGTCIAGMLKDVVRNLTYKRATYTFKNGACVSISCEAVPEMYSSEAYHVDPIILPYAESDRNAFSNLPFVLPLLLRTHAWLTHNKVH